MVPRAQLPAAVSLRARGVAVGSVYSGSRLLEELAAALLLLLALCALPPALALLALLLLELLLLGGAEARAST